MPDQPSLFDADHADDELVVPAQPSPADTSPIEPAHHDESEPDESHTALLLSLRGSSGNHDDAVIQVLRSAGIGLEEIVQVVTGAAEAPPLNTIDPAEVSRWVDRAAAQLVSPRRARGLGRVVSDLLDVQRWLDYYDADHSELVKRRAEVATAKHDRTYWRDRDARRTATPPIHVEVDPNAWRRVKLDTLRQGSTLGEVVGELVHVEVGAGGQTIGEDFGEVSPVRPDPGHPVPGRRASVFARIAIEDEVWLQFKTLTVERSLTVARAVGLLVERSARAK